MADFFDSSTFIAAVSEDDIDHEAAAKAWLSSEDRLLYAHGLLESFSVLSGGRHPAALTPGEASLLISRNVKTSRVKLVQFSADEILALLAEAHQRGIRGGSVYDYMHVAAARQSAATRIVTLNKRHFTAIAPDLSTIIVHPADVR